MIIELSANFASRNDFFKKCKISVSLWGDKGLIDEGEKPTVITSSALRREYTTLNKYIGKSAATERIQYF